jgi:hypothetical protein
MDGSASHAAAGAAVTVAGAVGRGLFEHVRWVVAAPPSARRLRPCHDLVRGESVVEIRIEFSRQIGVAGKVVGDRGLLPCALRAAGASGGPRHGRRRPGVVRAAVAAPHQRRVRARDHLVGSEPIIQLRVELGGHLREVVQVVGHRRLQAGARAAAAVEADAVRRRCLPLVVRAAVAPPPVELVAAGHHLVGGTAVFLHVELGRQVGEASQAVGDRRFNLAGT